MAAAKFSEEVFAAITKGITEKVLSEIDNLRDRLEAVSSPPDARRNDDMIARTSSVVADVLSLKRLVEQLEVRVATVEASCRTLLPLLPGIIKNDQADTTPPPPPAPFRPARQPRSFAFARCRQSGCDGRGAAGTHPRQQQKSPVLQAAQRCPLHRNWQKIRRSTASLERNQREDVQECRAFFPAEGRGAGRGAPPGRR